MIYPLREKRTLKRDFQRAIQRTALVAMIPLLLLTVNNTYSSFLMQGKIVEDMLGRLVMDRITGTSSAIVLPQVPGQVPEQEVFSAVQGILETIQSTQMQYDRFPGLEDLFDWQKATVSVRDLALFQVNWETTTLYESSEWSDEATLPSPFSVAFIGRMFAQETDLAFGPSDLGSIRVRLQPAFWTTQFAYLLFGLLLSAMLSLWLLLPFSSHFGRTFSQPFASMARILRNLADGEYGTAIRSRVKVRRPLREIQTIARDTNTLLEKLRAENDLQQKQQAELTSLNRQLSEQHEALQNSQREIQLSQIQLIQSQSLASVGQLTAAISHEISEPLERITDNLALQRNLLKDAMRKHDLSDIQRDVLVQLQGASDLNHMALDRVTALMQGLRNFARPETPEGEPADLRECVHSVVLITANLWKRRIRMLEEYADIPLFPFHPGMLNQVVMNLVVNAVHAIDGEGEIRIRIWLEGISANLSVTDTGTGIPEDILPRIFESGFTTKEAGKGSGLGLAICADIVRQHGGSLHVQSKVGEGSTFTVALPIRQAPVQIK